MPGKLNNCTLTGNSASYGGAAYGRAFSPYTPNNCVLTGNSAYEGGLACAGTLNNWLVYFNTATNGANYTQDEYTNLVYCCTTPMPTNGSTDSAGLERDDLNTWQEWRCQTDPTNALSALRLLSVSHDGTNVTVTWQSAAGVNDFLKQTTNLASPFSPLATDLPGHPGTTTYTDTNAATLAPLFYRVGVGN